MAEEGILVPGEPAEVESRARATGWVSKEEFDANPENSGKKWRPADEYLERGEIFQNMKSLRGELSSIKKDFQALISHHREVAKVEYQRALETLKAQRAQAAEEGDTKAMLEYSDRIDELKDGYQAQREETKATGTPSPAFLKFVEDYPAYQTDVEFKDVADAFANAYIARNPGSPFEDVVTHVRKKISEIYPKPGKKTVAPAVESGSTGIPVKSNGKLSKADLSDEEREVMRTFVRRGVMTEQEYIDELAKVKGN